MGEGKKEGGGGEGEREGGGGRERGRQVGGGRGEGRGREGGSSRGREVCSTIGILYTSINVCSVLVTLHSVLCVQSSRLPTQSPSGLS